jgi:hypothetical protein
LAAAGLVIREDDLAPGAADQFHTREAGFGNRLIDQASGKEMNAIRLTQRLYSSE